MASAPQLQESESCLGSGPLGALGEFTVEAAEEAFCLRRIFADAGVFEFHIQLLQCLDGGGAALGALDDILDGVAVDGVQGTGELVGGDGLDGDVSAGADDDGGVGGDDELDAGEGVPEGLQHVPLPLGMQVLVHLVDEDDAGNVRKAGGAGVQQQGTEGDIHDHPQAGLVTGAEEGDGHGLAVFFVDEFAVFAEFLGEIDAGDGLVLVHAPHHIDHGFAEEVIAGAFAAFAHHGVAPLADELVIQGGVHAAGVAAAAVAEGLGGAAEIAALAGRHPVDALVVQHGQGGVDVVGGIAEPVGNPGAVLGIFDGGLLLGGLVLSQAAPAVDLVAHLHFAGDAHGGVVLDGGGIIHHL